MRFFVYAILRHDRSCAMRGDMTSAVALIDTIRISVGFRDETSPSPPINLAGGEDRAVRVQHRVRARYPYDALAFASKSPNAKRMGAWHARGAARHVLAPKPIEHEKGLGSAPEPLMEQIPCRTIRSAEAVLNAHSRLRVLPFLNYGVAAQYAAGTALKAAGVIENRFAALVILIQASRAA